ncbi:MAG: hypothetical protein U0165_10935 [Polyangiaceae bacterium]
MDASSGKLVSFSSLAATDVIVDALGARLAVVDAPNEQTPRVRNFSIEQGTLVEQPSLDGQGPEMRLISVGDFVVAEARDVGATLLVSSSSLSVGAAWPVIDDAYVESVDGLGETLWTLSTGASPWLVRRVRATPSVITTLEERAIERWGNDGCSPRLAFYSGQLVLVSIENRTLVARRLDGKVVASFDAPVSNTACVDDVRWLQSEGFVALTNDGYVVRFGGEHPAIALSLGGGFQPAIALSHHMAPSRSDGAVWITTGSRIVKVLLGAGGVAVDDAFEPACQVSSLALLSS